jgi:hypothetical protein
MVEPDDDRELHRLLLAMPQDERATALMAAVCDGRNAVQQALQLVALVEVVSDYLNENERVALADCLVDAAVRMVTKWH